jgi:hypothetical protein
MSPDDADVRDDEETSDVVFGRPPTRPEPAGSGADELDADADAELDVTDDETLDLRDPDPAQPTTGVGVDEPTAGRGPEPTAGPLLGDADDLRRRWDAVQVGFVDDPHAAVEAADEMVTAAVAEIRAMLDGRRDALAAPWRDDPDPSTDALLQAFQDYRALFERVLSV